MYKHFESEDDLGIDTDFMTIGDIPYLSTKHIPNIKDHVFNKIITNDYKTNRAYTTRFNSNNPSDQFSNRFNFEIFYYVKDNIFDTNNWKKFEMDWKTKKATNIQLDF